MLTNLLVIKETLNYHYKKYEQYIQPVLKMIFFMIVYSGVNNTLGGARFLDRFLVVLLLSIFSTLVPIAWSVLFVILTIITHLFYISLDAGMLLGALLLVLYLMYIRMVPKMGYIILAVPVLYFFKIPYMIPLMAGVFLTPISILPTAFGVVLYYFAVHMGELLKFTSEEILDMPETFQQMFNYIISGVLGNRQMILTIIIFAVMILITYLVARMDIDYSWYIGIGIGSVSGIILFLVGDFAMDLTVQIGWMFIGMIFSGIIVSGMQFFKCTVDYSRAEKVQYEDDEYYYYVKAVPKIKVTIPQKRVKKIIH